MSELREVDIMLINSILENVPEECDHKFTLGYKIRRWQIIRYVKRLSSSSGRVRKPIRLKYVLIAAIVAIVAVISVLAGWNTSKDYDGYIVTDYGTYTMLYLRDDTSSYPKTIEKKFSLGYDLSDREIIVHEDDEFQYFVEYRKGDRAISINQVVADAFGGNRLNTENCLVGLTEIEINGWRGLYFQTAKEAHFYMLDTGEYFLSIVGGLDKEEMDALVKSLKL